MLVSLRSSAVRLNTAFVVALLLGHLPTTTAADSAAAKLDFDRDIRPILSDHCFECHGPDVESRQTDLRLDTREGLFEAIEGQRPVVPGDPRASKVFRRITSADAEQRMPPPEARRQLTPAAIERIKLWIEQGATWQQHWAFVAPQRPPLPAVANSPWVRNPIDAFVLARLEREDFSPSPEADKATLLRRASFDLTGLPPSPEELDALLADDSPDAFEQAVDRLLHSPRYGERLAVEWLDAARYADTAGYQTDGVRQMWRWRDWVIDAFNAGMPFDQFTIEQLAGDLLPRPTLSQQIATGFNRNHRANSEGGIVPEEFLAEYAADRVETTFTVWQGLTLGCTRCHDHKYDPFTQKDFYRLFAYFNNLPERGRVIKYGNSPPLIAAPTPFQQEQRERLVRELQTAHEDFARRRPDLLAAQAEWEANVSLGDVHEWSIADGLLRHFSFDGSLRDDANPGFGGRFAPLPGRFSKGPFGEAAELDQGNFIEADSGIVFTGADKFSFSLWLNTAEQSGGTLLSLMDDEDSRDKGFSLDISTDGKVQVQFGPRWLDDAVRIETEPAAITAGRWHHLALTYDGTQMGDGLKIFVDGKQQPTAVRLDLFTGTFTTDKLFLRIGSRGRSSGFVGRLDELRYFARRLSPHEINVLACSDRPADIARIPAAKRTPPQQAKIDDFFLRNEAPEAIRDSHARVKRLEVELATLDEKIPNVMVMAERPAPRETFLLVRGQYDQPGEQVSRGTPASLPAPPTSSPDNRLGLAQWLVDPANPLTARVAVNRFWQMYFGAGLVRTTEDFGSQGERPTHPELLDWLAVEFMESGWDVKALQRLIVTSATYRQSSHVSPEQLRRDPENRLLGRAPRLRLSAEMIRDQALAAGGLMHGVIGGPSVKTYQPAGLWKEIASDTLYEADRGAALYRRSLYTFWKRTVPPPTMTTFDATAREACTVRRSRTNTPLQALALLNDVTYVEASRGLAERMLAAGGTTAESRIAYGFRLVNGRPPDVAEAAILRASLARFTARFDSSPDAARDLIAIGQSSPPAALAPVELAAHTALANLLLNLDEAVMRP